MRDVAAAAEIHVWMQDVPGRNFDVDAGCGMCHVNFLRAPPAPAAFQHYHLPVTVKVKTGAR